MTKRKYIIFIIGIVIPMCIAIGFSTWIILLESNIKNNYEPGKVFDKYYANTIEVVYDGNNHIPQATYPEYIDTTNLKISYKTDQNANYILLTNSTEIKDVGTYYFKYEVEGVESSIKNIKLDITPKILELSNLNIEWTETTYNSQTQRPSISVSSGLIYDEQCNISYSDNFVNSENAGSYSISKENLVLDNSNYKLNDNLSISYEIKQKELTAIWVNLITEYNGLNQSPSLSMSGNIEGDDLTLSIEQAERINAGAYPLEALISGSDTGNYKLVNSPENPIFQITKRPVILSWENLVTVYDNTKGQLPVATISEILSNDDCLVALSISEKNDAGEYPVEASLEGSKSVNYEISNTEDITKTFVINKKPLSELSYDAITINQGDSITSSDVKIRHNEREVPSSQYNFTSFQPVSNGSFTVYAKEDGNYSGQIVINYTITSAFPLLLNDTSTQQTKTYDGQPAEILLNVKNNAGETINTGYTIHYDSIEKVVGQVILSSIEKVKDAAVYRIRLYVSHSDYANSSTIEIMFTIYHKELEGTWANTELRYNGTSQSPTFSITNLVEGDTCGVTVEGAKTDTNLKSGVADYTATLSSPTNPNYKIPDGGISTNFHILPLDLYIMTPVIEMDYNSAIRKWQSFKDDAQGRIRLMNGANQQVTTVVNIISMNNGTFWYGENYNNTVCGRDNLNSLDSTGLSSWGDNENVVGSTYSATIGVVDKNYKINSNSNKLIIKYRTAKIGNTYYTIEEAFEASGTITFAGDATNPSSYVYTAFCDLPTDVYPYTDKSKNFVLNGRQLIVPFENSTSILKKQTGQNGGAVYSALYIPKTVTITLIPTNSNDSKIAAAALISYIQPKTSEAINRGVIINQGKIYLNSANGRTSKLESYGYIKGNGEIRCNNGTECTTAFSVKDFPGGTAGSSIYSKALVTNAWSINNISCDLFIYGGAVYKAYLLVEVRNQALDAYADIIGSPSSSNCLFKPKSITDTNFVKITSYPARKWSNNLSQHGGDYDKLYTVNGSNSEIGQRFHLEINGEYYDSTLSLAISIFFITVNFKTSKDIALTMGLGDLTLKSNSKLYLNNSSYIFYPGSIVTIEKGAYLETGNGVNISILRSNEIPSGNKSYTFTCSNADLDDPRFINNGEMRLNGSIGGFIETTEPDALIFFSENGVTSSCTIMRDTGDPRVSTISSIKAKGNLDTGMNQDFSAAPYVSMNINGTYCWVPASGTISYTLNFKDQQQVLIESKVIYEIPDAGQTNPSYTITGAEYDYAPNHYRFVKWVLTDGTDAVGQSVPAGGTIDLIAVYEPIEYIITYQAKYNGEYVNPTYANKLESFTIEDFNNGVLNITTIATYNNKSFVGWYIGIDDSTGVSFTALPIQVFDSIYDEFMSSSIPLFCTFIDEVVYNVNVSTDFGVILIDSSTCVSSHTYSLQEGTILTLPNLTDDTLNNYNDNMEQQKYFAGWSISNTTYQVGDEITIESNMTIKALWRDKNKVNVSASYASVKIGIYTFNATFEPSAAKELYAIPGVILVIEVQCGEGYIANLSIDGVTQNLTCKYTMPASDITITATAKEEGCVTADTLITLADGTKVRIDSLKGDELIRVWNHTTGQFESEKIAYIISHDEDEKEHDILTLLFSNGINIDIIAEHIFFDATINSYVTISYHDFEKFIGHEFVIVNSQGEIATTVLVNAIRTVKKTRSFEIITYRNITCFTNDILSASAYVMPLVSVFEFEKGKFTYDIERMLSDIELYGLYTYDDFKDLISEEVFNMHNVPYLKIGVEKGIITWEDIISLIELFYSLGSDKKF